MIIAETGYRWLVFTTKTHFFLRFTQFIQLVRCHTHNYFESFQNCLILYRQLIPDNIWSGWPGFISTPQFDEGTCIFLYQKIFTQGVLWSFSFKKVNMLTHYPLSIFRRSWLKSDQVDYRLRIVFCVVFGRNSSKSQGKM